MIIQHISGYISLHDAGRIAGVNPESFRNMLKRGRLNCNHIGGKYVLSWAESRASSGSGWSPLIRE